MRLTNTSVLVKPLHYHACIILLKQYFFLFGQAHLRKPTTEDIDRLLMIGEFPGFLEMMGSIDFMHWE